MIERLRKINEHLLRKYENNSKELEKQVLIGKMLLDNDCFSKISIEVAYAVLKDLEIENEEIDNIYKELLE